MTAPLGALRASTPTAPPAAASADDKLRDVARQLEGVFVEQLFKAMRETVPEGGALSGGSGEEMFQGLMDQHLAADTPGEWSDGLAAALYRQLRGQAPAPGPEVAAPATALTPEAKGQDVV